MMEKQFAGKVALVTGGASGIGLATVQAFAREGAKVVVADTREKEGKALAESLRREGAEILFQPCDVSRADQVQAMISETLRTFGRLDFACNNAGIESKVTPTAECDEETWDRIMAVNLKGVWLCMKHEIPIMLKQGAGSIVNISSIAGLVGFPGLPAYVSSKHAVIGLTRVAAIDYARQGIRVNVVCPGVIDTPMVDRYVQGDAALKAQMTAGEPMGRIGRPEEIASAVLWLCTPGAAFTTGHPLVVDGGWVAQ